MGICLRNKSYGIDMGYGSFYQLRCVIAKQLNKEFGENYANLSRCYSKADFAKNDEIANYWIEKFSLDEDIIDFLYQLIIYQIIIIHSLILRKYYKIVIIKIGY